MNKSILVIDTPECCKECPCASAEEEKILNIDYGCRATGKEINESEFNAVSPDWCPLKKNA